MGNIKNIGSTFGIDVRRKIWCSENRSDWLKGEIDPNCLKRIAWQFEEVLTSATDQYGKAYDELTAGLREALKTFTKLLRGVSLGKDVNNISAESGESKSTQSALMEAAGAIAAFTGSDVSDDILREAFMIAPKYNIPARSAVPKVQIPISTGGIKVCFSYGKAGLFNAKEEVWDPIKNIMASLSPQASNSEKYEGLLDIENSSTIPFEFQSKYYFIKSATSLITDESGNINIKDAVQSFSNATSSISTTVKEATEVQLRIDRELSKQADAYKKSDENIAELRDDGDDKGLTSDKLFTGERSANEVGGHPIIKGRLKGAVRDYSDAEKKLSGYTHKGQGKFSEVPLSKKDTIKDMYEDGSLYQEKAEVLDKVAQSGGDIAESTQVNECGAGCCGGKKKKDKKKKKDIDEVYDIVKELQLKTLIDESEADVTFIYDESVDNIVDSEVYSDLCEALDTLDEIDYEVDDQDPSCLAVWEK